ncbi:MAG: coniferyl-alcohol dehydrogenase [Acidimicrobiia bacterium]|nr:coniferyl-alcohol dehydrogenase [Acidimicrobiia bacterium]
MTRVVVTGAASGIGNATAARLVAAGHEVVSLDIKEPQTAVASHVPCDMSDPAAIDSALSRLEGTFGSLLNIAGVPGRSGAENTIRVNTLGLRHLTDALWDRIDDGGTVVNVSSIAGNQWKRRQELHQAILETPDFGSGLEWWTENEATVGVDAYTFSKEAVVLYTMYLAGRGLSRGIRCNDVGPGPVDTPILPDFAHDVGETQMQWMVDQIGRPATPDDIAEVLVLLAGDTCKWINGQHIIVDGGLTSGLQSRWIDTSTSPLRQRKR